ncbi:hypothetical protein CHS0354_021309 [Potamilus streckersoni]|uniref:WD repeat-containing protein 76 n=1 Tax=Potamilus streckersoni TaxID=2493646 RepID=A0AAE0TKF5_9BIVA|nr:hypothetical protein CHS0354_021309 [Potamilus streckersoni]
MPSTRSKRKFESAVEPSKKAKVQKVTSPRKTALKEPALEKIVTENQSEESCSDSDSELEGIDEGIIRCEERRQINLKLNAEFFSSLRIEEAKASLQESKTQKHPKPSQRGLKREKLEEPIIRRSSLRLQKKDPNGIPLPPEALINRADNLFYQEPVDEHERPPAGPLKMTKSLYSTVTVEEHKVLMELRDKMVVKPLQSNAMSFTDFSKVLDKLVITENQVCKVVPDRTLSVAVHPMEDIILAVTGDRWGRLGFWNVSSTSDAVVTYCPHSRPITCLDFPRDNSHLLLSCSYDGTLRCGDLHKEVFDEVYSTPKKKDILFRNFDYPCQNTLLVSRNDGCVALVDRRTKGTKAEHTYRIGQKSMRTVSIHPRERHYFVNAFVDGRVCLWDLRNLKKNKNKPLQTLPHGRNLNSAYFSPITGKYILITSMEDVLNIYDSSNMSDISLKKSIRHNNHTGKWLTGFRATWHPAREDVFIVGSMNRPREIQIYGDDGYILRRLRSNEYLNSVCSLNVFHPTRSVVVGANSSGRLHVFM